LRYAAPVIGQRSRGLRRERVLASPQFSDGLFRNSRPTPRGPRRGTRLELGRELLLGGQARRPPRPLPAVSPLPVWARPVETGLRVTWLGHSTMLLELDGLRVLTDPVWSDRISPVPGVGPRRFQPVPIPIEALPPLDAIVVSHDHFDHLDRPTIARLLPRGVPFVTGLGVGAHLEAWGVPAAQIHELDWWERATLRGGELAITATPAQHFSGRVVGGDRTLWTSVVIETARRRVFFSGDTGLTPQFAEIAARLAPFDLVMLEVGGFHPAWDHVHMGPVGALEAFRMLGGGRLMPVHWGTFNLALHAWDWPAETAVELAAAQGVELVMPRLGAPFEPARGLPLEPWWRAGRRSDAGAAAPAIDPGGAAAAGAAP
jgi:L-ascorbate metabolism protein UlaG (beta-lactamase superfamily)